MGFLLASAEEVFQTKREPFIQTIEAITSAASARAAEVYSKLEYGGITPKEGQYGQVTLRPEMFYGADGNELVGTFRQNLTTTGWVNPVISADLSEKGPVGEKWVMGIYGITIPDPVKRITQIRLRKGDFTFPVMDIELAQAEAKPITILFKVEGDPNMFVFDYTAKFYLDAYVESTGYQTIKPEGVAYLPKEKAIAETF